jgi:hypothetical protein
MHVIERTPSPSLLLSPTPSGLEGIAGIVRRCRQHRCEVAKRGQGSSSSGRRRDIKIKIDLTKSDGGEEPEGPEEIEKSDEDGEDSLFV